MSLWIIWISWGFDRSITPNIGFFLFVEDMHRRRTWRFHRQFFWGSQFICPDFCFFVWINVAERGWIRWLTRSKDFWMVMVPRSGGVSEWRGILSDAFVKFNSNLAARRITQDVRTYDRMRERRQTNCRIHQNPCYFWIVWCLSYFIFKVIE